MKCPKCGKEIANDSIFCEYCGAKVIVSKSKNSIRISFAVVLSLCVIGGIIGLLFLYNSDNIPNTGIMNDAQQMIPNSVGEESVGFVDLGLPSGTLWKDNNEAGGFYTYEEAVYKFGTNLPAKEHFEELEKMCRWTWTGSGYKVTGPNGNSIILPALGGRDCRGRVGNVGSYGNYWSSTPDGSECAWYFAFNSSNVYMLNRNRCYGVSVRLVQK